MMEVTVTSKLHAQAERTKKQKREEKSTSGGENVGLVLKAVPASQEDLQLRAHSRCKRRLMDSASAALVLSSDAAPHQVACIMPVLIDSLLFGHWSLLVLGPCVLP